MKSFKRRMLLFFIGGFAAVIIGAIVGMFIGALFGGMLTAIIDIPRFYGGLPGYEGTGALGLVLGSTFSPALLDKDAPTREYTSYRLYNLDGYSHHQFYCTKSCLDEAGMEPLAFSSNCFSGTPLFLL